MSRSQYLLIVLFLLWCCRASAATPEQQAPAVFDFAAFKGKTLIVLLYSIDDPRAGQAVELMKELYGIRKEFNGEIVGVCLNADRLPDARRFAHDHAIPFSVFADAGGSLARRFNIKGGLGLLICNSEGKVLAVKDEPAARGRQNLAPAWKGFINRYVKIGYVAEDVPLLGYKPPMPAFEATALNGATINSARLAEKKPLVIVIFSPSCSHCEHELEFLRGLYTGAEFKNRFEIVAVSRGNQKATEEFVKSKSLNFPVLLDGDGAISSLFPSFVGSVPLSYLVGRDGRIHYQHTGFSDHTADTYLMELRKLCGLPNKPLLVTDGYSGQERCAVCHERQHVQWSLSRHSDAFLSLVRKGSERDAACVSCHVTGFDRPGGYSLTDMKNARRFESVQCEACHGPGYQSCAAFTGAKAEKRSREQWKALCVSCHTEKESLNFNFEARFPKVLHAAVPNLAAMSRPEREALLKTYREKKNLFDNPAAYVGAASCNTCHEAQYKHWQTTVHASAHRTERAHAAPDEKRRRYYTGVGGQGGYPEPGREGVQCESCHGPGERHVKEPQKKGHEYIVSLSQECSSCVVEQICRRCHGPEDDPGFDFNEAIPKIRHPQQSP